MVTNNAINIPTGASGTILRGAGVGSAPTFSTATYPNTAGTSGNVLTSDGTNFNSSASTGVGNLVLIQSQTASTSASLAFTTGITATYNNYMLVVSNYLPATNTQSLELQISTNGGSSYIATGYVGGTIFGTTATGLVSGTAATTFFMLMTSVDNATRAGCGTYYLMDFTNGAYPNITGLSNAGVTSAPLPFVTYGLNSTGTVNAFQVLSASGNMTQGKFTLYGIKES